MSLVEIMDYPSDRPDGLDDLRQRLHRSLDDAIAFCLAEQPRLSFLDFEKALLPYVSSLALLLIQLFLFNRHRCLDLSPWLGAGRRLLDSYATRKLKTTFGWLTYGRAYLIPSKGSGPGLHPLDALLGLTRDSFSPLLISHFCRLATQASYRLACELGGMCLGWAPPASAVQEWTLGLGRPAHVWLSTAPPKPGDGEVLVAEFDGKAVPTATEAELSKRRGKRQNKKKACADNCQRHRARDCRKAGGKKKRRKRGDKSKNGRSATLVVMYTLKQGADGRLHGPINKKVYATFSSRSKALLWARQEATRRGFGPDSDKVVQLVLDGEVCLEQQLRKLFPKAILTLDIRHAEEKLWQVGRQLHAEGSEELAAWVELRLALLHEGKVAELLEELRAVKFQGPGGKKKRAVQRTVVTYLEKRVGLMQYGEWRKKDLVLASGAVEGAARYLIGERLDKSGMRWVVEKGGEALLLLRCIEVNGDWDEFFAWAHRQNQEQMHQGKSARVRSKIPTQVPEVEKASEARRRRRVQAASPAEPAKKAG